MKSFARSALTGLSVISMLGAISVAFAYKGGPKPAPVPFAKVDKIIQTRCIGCHRGEKAAAGVDLSSYSSILKAKFKGKAVVVAKKPKDSVFVAAITGHGVAKMPPGPPLSAAEVKLVQDWIASGAKK